MLELKNDELKQIAGGFELTLTNLTLLAVGVPFVIGFIDGFTSTNMCN